jgi:TolB-like protein/DNA-binding winged helix-turn-helix (wHTH) protein/Tfp pilus assembly protein PilF
MLDDGPGEAGRDLSQASRETAASNDASTPAGAPARLRFGRFELDPVAGTLAREGVPVKLQPQPFKVLALLLRRAGDVVTREEIRHEVWGDDTFVNFEQGLAYCMTQVRNALGEQAQDAHYIQTLPRRGYRFVAPVSAVAPALEQDLPAAPASAPSPSWRRPVLLAALGAAALVAVLLVARTLPTPAQGQGRTMVAVLPFEDLGPEASVDHLGDGMTEDVITEIGRVSPERIGVIARSSAMRYKDARPEMGKLGEELGVSHVLEGSVRREGSRVRVTARLVRVKDGAQLWARSYDRELREVLALQSQVAADVASMVGGTLSPRDERRARPLDPEVYRLLTQASYFWHQRTDDGFRKALAADEEAARRDPGCAAAFAGIARSWIGLAEVPGVSREEAFARARDAVDRALALDPSLPEAHAMRAAIAAIHEYDWVSAEQGYQRALALNPSDPTAHQWYSLLLDILGRPPEAIDEARRAFASDPVSASISQNLASMLLMAGRAQEAMAQADVTLALQPDHGRAHGIRGQALLALGQPKEALRELETASARVGPDARLAVFQARALTALGRPADGVRLLTALMQDKPWTERFDHYDRALVLNRLGRNDDAFAELTKSLDAKESHVRFAIHDDALSALQHDSRMAEVERRLRLR